jgi:4a-hydroxytetrahydrobiopterin dehydratase
MSRLNAAEIGERLKSVPNWALENGEIVRTFQFPDFLGAMRFVDLVAEKAESAEHHPDIDIRYNKVRLTLTSHDAGGLTEKDFSLASECDVLFPNLQ